MPVKVVVGAQWGDEGKGKVVDYLSQEADLVVRFQGGDNAGHTVINEYGTFRLHIVPCGIFNPSAVSLAGTGMVVNPDELLRELDELAGAGVDTGRLRISARAHILMPYHVDLDLLAEKNGFIGTTKRGIGPAYADRALRYNLRFEDLLDQTAVEERIAQVLPEVNRRLEAEGIRYSKGDILGNCRRWAESFRGIIVDPVPFVHDFLGRQKRILFEGQLGIMRDIDLGVYPYVTSSNPVAACAAVSAGIPARHITDVVGVMKAFSSAVGNGPFPTEMGPDEAAPLRGTGENADDEFGARTGRARRLGWLDLPVVRYGHLVNGFTGLALCKLDKLDGMPEMKVCTGYEIGGKAIVSMPSAIDLARAKPIYEVLPGWMQSTRGAARIRDLPENALRFIRFIESSVGVPVTIAGVGPGRNDVAR